jgi:hypothetical protein
MVDPAVNKVLSSCHGSGVAISVGGYIGGRRLVEVVAWPGTSTSEVSTLTAIVVPSIPKVLQWPLNGLLVLHILTSRGSSLGGVGALYELALWSPIALHCPLGSLLKLSSGWLLESTLDRSSRWHTYPGTGVVATRTLAFLLPLEFHDIMVAF